MENDVIRGALELHLAAKRLADRTKDGYRYNLEQYVADWLDRPLAELGADRSAARERHRKITEKHGAPSADNVFRIFRAVYNRGLREHPELPPNPCGNVDYHGLRRRKVDANGNKLRAWGEAVLKLHPVRRDLHLFMMMTGMRRGAACEARAADLDMTSKLLHVPKPKGGSSRAFDLPLSGPLADLFGHRVSENPRVQRGAQWLFPADSESGHVAEVVGHDRLFESYNDPSNPNFEDGGLELGLGCPFGSLDAYLDLRELFGEEWLSLTLMEYTERLAEGELRGAGEAQVAELVSRAREEYAKARAADFECSLASNRKRAA